MNNPEGLVSNSPATDIATTGQRVSMK